MRAALLMVALLAACGQQSVVLPADDKASNATVHQADSPKSKTAATAKPYKVEEENDLYSFLYSWSAEAAAVPELVGRFTGDVKKTRPDMQALKEEREVRTRSGGSYPPYDIQKSYETAGQTDRLLSLELSVYAFTGGAHGSSGSGSLVWDRHLKREVSIQDLLQPGAGWTGAIRQPFCVLLDREREKRRGEPVKPDDLFGDCPKYGDVTVLLSDGDKNARFDQIRVIADQYVAGPYAEGPYEIALPITATMIERLRPDYRPSFEPRPPVK